MWYAQTLAFTDDEGFHLLAAQLIKGGMRPYLDFCFPQTPLNAYWNAFLMRVFGESWRGPHALAALETSAATVLAAQFVLTRLPERTWQVAGAIAATVMIGCNINLVEFGPLGRLTALPCLLTVCAFRLALAAVERRGWWLASACGVLAGAAAASTLLRRRRGAGIGDLDLVGTTVPEADGSRRRPSRSERQFPSCRYFGWPSQSPWVVWFNIVEYQLHYRVVYWPDPLPHDLETLTAWTRDPQSLLLGLLAIFGVVYIAKRSSWTREHRAEFYLCGWLALGIAAELAFAHPTFRRYFCLGNSLFGNPRGSGAVVISSRVLQLKDPFWPVFHPCVISMWARWRATISRAILMRTPGRITRPWQENCLEVTPAGKQIFTDEKLYFLIKRRPPSGMEFGVLP